MCRFAASPDIDISKIEQSYLDAREMTASGDYSRYADLNREFHSEIWAASGNKRCKYDRRTVERTFNGQHGHRGGICGHFYKGA